MPRQPRFSLSGHPQHVIVRGNNRNNIFHRHKDYIVFLDTMKHALEKYQCNLHAYVLMTNHAHFLLTPQIDGAISNVMQALGRSYVQYFNKKYLRTGTLWEGRYKASLVDSERYALTCYRYIELNPVRAKMVVSPEDYEWSSYRCNVLGTKNELVTPHDLYLRLGENKKQRLDAYGSLFAGHLAQQDINQIRDATNKCWAFGSSEFLRRVSRQVDRPLQSGKRGGDRRSKDFNRV